MGGLLGEQSGALDALLRLDHPRKAAAAEWAAIHLGEHTDEVLAELGVDASGIETLRNDGVIL